MNLADFWSGMWGGPSFSALVNHLWQSTAVASAAWVLAVALRKNQARVRYWVWFVASVKFLVPFSVLVELGTRLRAVIPAEVVRPAAASVMGQVVQPFAQGSMFEGSAYAVATAVHPARVWPVVLLTIWAFGAMVVALKWALGWLRLQRAVKRAEPVPEFVLSHPVCEWSKNQEDRVPCYPKSQNRDLGHPGSLLELAVNLPVLCSAALVEPGIFGIFQPVLLLPEGIVERLEPPQLRAIVAHEMCHARRRDNLTFAVHMIVQILFWFLPPVWWIGERLIAEREQACDEAVIAQGSAAQAYAEGILTVCKFYVESPAACAAGVTGSDLKKRIVRIMSDHVVRGLDLRRKFLLCAAGALALALPLLLGVVHAGALLAETKAEDELATLPKFDVASIKPHKDEPNGMMRIGFGPTPDGIRANGVPLQMIVTQAFGISRDRILNEPDWVQSSRYDLEAKVSPEDASKLNGLTQRQRGVMLLPVLEDRFGLKFHHETRELNVYTLVVAKGGPKLKVAQLEPVAADAAPMVRPGGGDAGPGGPGPGDRGQMPAPRAGQSFMRMSPQGATLEGRGVPIDNMVAFLSREIGATVLDKTGLTDKYDYTLNFMPEFGARAGFGPPPPPPPSAPAGGPAPGGGPESAPADTPPSLVDAIQQQLGLKLVQQKEPVDVIVIDHIEQPSAN